MTVRTGTGRQPRSGGAHRLRGRTPLTWTPRLPKSKDRAQQRPREHAPVAAVKSARKAVPALQKPKKSPGRN